jgi:DNA polymerase-3 subunit epsilon
MVLFIIIISTFAIIGAMQANSKTNKPSKSPSPPITYSEKADWVVVDEGAIKRRKLDAAKKLESVKGRKINFTAFDFETANQKRASACAIGIAVVEKGEIVHTEFHLINPRTNDFEFTYLHGISKKDVENAPVFAELWPKIKHHFEGKKVAAHNANFDIQVLDALKARYAIESTDCAQVIDTLDLARRTWGGQENNKLSTLAEYFGLELDHHNAISDAKVCAQIALLHYEEKYQNRAPVDPNVVKLKNEAKRLQYQQSYGEDGYVNLHYVFSVPVLIRFGKAKSSKYEDAVTFFKQQPTFKSFEEDGVMKYEAVFNTMDRANLKYAFFLTQNWASRRIEVAGKEVTQPILNNAMYHCSLHEEDEYYMEVDYRYRLDPEFAHLANTFDAVRIRPGMYENDDLV